MSSNGLSVFLHAQKIKGSIKETERCFRIPTDHRHVFLIVFYFEEKDCCSLVYERGGKAVSISSEIDSVLLFNHIYEILSGNKPEIKTELEELFSEDEIKKMIDKKCQELIGSLT